MATTTQTPKVGRPFVALHGKIASDIDYGDLSYLARTTFTGLLAWSGIQGAEGLVPSSGRHVARAAQLFTAADGDEAIRELLDAEYLVETDDPTKLRIRSWDRYQPQLGTRQQPVNADRSRAQQLRRHNAGEHTTPSPLCEACQAQPVGNTPAPEAAPVEVVVAVPEQDPEVKPARTPKPGSMGEVLAQFTETLDAAVADTEEPFAVYRQGLETADIAAANPDVARRSKDARTSLRGHVMAHALRFYLGDTATSTVIAAALRGAKTIGADGHYWYIYAAAEASGRVFETERNVIGWLKTVATHRRAEQKGR